MSGTPEEWTDWDVLIKQCATYDELTTFEKSKAQRALLFLKREFGEGFLKESLEGLNRDNLQPEKVHPIMQYFMNSAPWTRKWITRFAEEIESLKGADGYSKLLIRLKDKKKFYEGVSVLEVAYKLFKAGFSIVFDPTTTDTRKVPDIKLKNRDSGEELFVEVSIQQESLTRTKAARNFWEFFGQFSPFLGLLYCGRILKILSERHMAEIIRELKDKIELSKKDCSFQELVIEGVIEVGIAPQTEKELLETWAKSRGLQIGRFSGPPVSTNEIPRTMQKMEREQQQLPRNSPNLLIIQNNNLFKNFQEVKSEMDELEECLYALPNLLAFIAIGYSECFWSVQDEVVMKDQHVAFKRLRPDATLEQCMILLNRYCDFPLSPGTISKIYLAFNRY